jgi:hypothetical protein
MRVSFHRVQAISEVPSCGEVSFAVSKFVRLGGQLHLEDFYYRVPSHDYAAISRLAAAFRSRATGSFNLTFDKDAPECGAWIASDVAPEGRD